MGDSKPTNVPVFILAPRHFISRGNIGCSAWELTFDNFSDYVSFPWPLISSKRVTDMSTQDPLAKDDCSGTIIGNSYCVEVSFEISRPTSPKTSSTRTK
jgi:hypothetical protein